MTAMNTNSFASAVLTPHPLPSPLDLEVHTCLAGLGRGGRVDAPSQGQAAARGRLARLIGRSPTRCSSSSLPHYPLGPGALTRAADDCKVARLWMASYVHAASKCSSLSGCRTVQPPRQEKKAFTSLHLNLFSTLNSTRLLFGLACLDLRPAIAAASRLCDLRFRVSPPTVDRHLLEADPTHAASEHSASLEASRGSRTSTQSQSSINASISTDPSPIRYFAPPAAALATLAHHNLPMQQILL